MTFHSGTDKTDLYTTAPKLPMFLSLIVNYACETDCELAMAIEKKEVVLTKSSWKLKSWKQNKKEKNKLETKLTHDTYVVKCNVVYEHEYTQEDEWLFDMCEALQKPKYTPQYSLPRYEPPSYQSRQTTIDLTTTPTTGLTPTVKSKVVQSMADLFTLGEQDKLTPFLAYVRITYALKTDEMETYIKAFKQYFDEWYEQCFYTTAVTKKETLVEVQTFINFHEKMLLHKPLTEAINELQESSS